MGVREEAKGKGTLSSPVLQQFLRASLDTIEDEAWTEALSCELSRWLSSSACSSGEKVSYPGSTQLYSCRCPTGAGLRLVLCPHGMLMLLPQSVPPRGPFPAICSGMAKARPCSCSQRLPGSVGPSHQTLHRQVRLLPHLSFFLSFPSHAVFPVQGSGDSAGSL